MDNAYRLVVMVDVEATSLDEAYGKVYTAMTKTGEPWESTDEAFHDGEQVDADDLQAARMKYLDKKFPDLYTGEQCQPQS